MAFSKISSFPSALLTDEDEKIPNPVNQKIKSNANYNREINAQHTIRRKPTNL